MKDKSAKNKIEMMLLGIVVAMLAITFVIALTDGERQKLENELVFEGHDWLNEGGGKWKIR